MRISELSRQSGVSVPTIKFYLREGLLPAGLPTGRNQADYSERHLRRIRLIRTLSGIAGLDLSSVREILAAIDDDEVSLRDAYQVLDRALYLDGSETLGRAAVDCARTEVAEFADSLGWSRETSASGGEVLAQVLAGLRSLGCEADAPSSSPTPAPPSSSSSRSSTCSPATAGPRRVPRSCAASCSGSPCPPCAAWRTSTTPPCDSH